MSIKELIEDYEFGWVGDKFCVWINDYDWADFKKSLIQFVGIDYFINKKVQGILLHDCIVISMNNIFEYCGESAEKMYPKNKNKH